jgi:hypothetical protein
MSITNTDRVDAMLTRLAGDGDETPHPVARASLHCSRCDRDTAHEFWSHGRGWECSEHDGDRPSLAYGGACSVCGDVVPKTIKGVCGECRQLEGSVWQYEWGG